MSVALEASNQAVSEGTEPYVISGERKLLAVHDLSQDMSRMRQLFELFEHKTSLVRSSTCRCAAKACRYSSAANRASRRPTR